MKRVLAILTALFALTFLSAAQTGGSSGSSSGSQGSSDQGTTKKSSHKGGGPGGSTLTGCLTGPNDEGAYVLKSGKRSVEVGGLDDLSKHVNHQVKLHGSWAKSGAEIGEKEEKGGKGEEKGERHFKVTSIDHIADTCSGGAGGSEAGEHHHKKGASSGSSGTSQPSTPPKS